MTARLRVNRDALADNYRLFRSAVQGDCAAVVKADAYGTGLAEAAAVFAGLGCRQFFVATAAEGLALREVMAGASIFVFEGVFAETGATLADAGLIPVVNHAAQLVHWKPYASREIAVHVDTGMNRLGHSTDLTAASLDGFRIALLMTHLACADQPEHPLNETQLARFASVAERFPGVPTSIGNSAGALLGSRYQGDLARPGIGLYGGNPWSGRSSPVRQVATLEAPILQIRDVQPGESVGYGATWRSDRRCRLAVLGLGYADGLPRRLSNRGQAVVGGRRCAMAGRVSMDLTVVDVSETRAAPGDWAQLFGPALPVDEVAERADTLAYELLTGISPRVLRVYEGG